MKKLNIAALLAAGAIAVNLAGRARAEKIPPEMFGALPNVSEAAISPDGKRVALLQNQDNASGVIIYNLDDPALKPVGARVGALKARSIQWADNNYILLLVSSAERPYGDKSLTEFWRWASVSASTGEPAMLFKNECTHYLIGSGELLATTPETPGDAVFQRYECERSLTLYKVDLASGKRRRQKLGAHGTYQWIVDAHGAPVARFDYDYSQQKIRVFHIETDGVSKQIAEFPQKRIEDAVIGAAGLAADRRHLLLIQNADEEGGRRSLVEMDLATGAIGKTLFRNDSYDIDRSLYDAAAATVIGVRYVDDLPRSFYLDAQNQKLQQQLRKALPGAAPTVTSRSTDGSRMIVRVAYTDGPDQIFLFDRSNKRLVKITATYDALDSKTYAHKEKYDYTSPDGLVIHGYLTVPKGAAKKNLPLIVLPHGGPEGRDDQSFDWWSFFYAARGYLVYQPNFRGSDGYGEAFKEAGYGEWGRKMQDDITDGVKKLIADGIADPKRICIVGGSYGGYAALAGATLTPDLYACAVSVAGISNLVVMIGDDARRNDDASDYWAMHIGSRFRERKELDQTSPANLAYRAKAPILLIHGKDDTVVPFKQSEFMRDALLANGKTVEFVELDGEDHWLSRGKTRTEMLAKSIAFIDRYIGRKSAKAAVSAAP